MAMTRTKQRWARVVVVALGVALAVDGYRLYRAAGMNRQIESGAALEMAGSLPDEALFAQARALEQKNDHQGALALYKQLYQEGTESLRLAARYNSANTCLRQALALQDEGDRPLMLPLVELAKEGYRAVLRAQPQHWDARYNLERALRLAPEQEDAPPEEAASVHDAERAVTTMRGISLGLP